MRFERSFCQAKKCTSGLRRPLTRSRTARACGVDRFEGVEHGGKRDRDRLELAHDARYHALRSSRQMRQKEAA
jgi:hypothetical protein